MLSNKYKFSEVEKRKGNGYIVVNGVPKVYFKSII